MIVKQLKPSVNANNALIAVIYPFAQSQLWQTFPVGPSAEQLGMMTVSDNMLLHHSVIVIIIKLSPAILMLHPVGNTYILYHYFVEQFLLLRFTSGHFLKFIHF